MKNGIGDSLVGWIYVGGVATGFLCLLAAIWILATGPMVAAVPFLGIAAFIFAAFAFITARS
jgi:hypothetical protein